MGYAASMELGAGSERSSSSTHLVKQSGLWRRFQKRRVVVAMVVCVPAILFQVR